MEKAARVRKKVRLEKIEGKRSEKIMERNKILKRMINVRLIRTRTSQLFSKVRIVKNWSLQIFTMISSVKMPKLDNAQLQ